MNEHSIQSSSLLLHIFSSIIFPPTLLGSQNKTPQKQGKHKLTSIIFQAWKLTLVSGTVMFSLKLQPSAQPV